jgi:hypothetical protein
MKRRQFIKKTGMAGGILAAAHDAWVDKEFLR